MRPFAEIEVEREAFESQFVAAQIPKGTPNRKKLQAELDAEVFRRSCSPENIAIRQALSVEATKAVAAERRRATMARKAKDPEECNRAVAFKYLRRWGFKRERAKGSSAYYLRASDGVRVRVSDHEVPETLERTRNVENGGFSWAIGGCQIRVDATPYEFARNLVEARRRVAK